MDEHDIYRHINQFIKQQNLGRRNPGDTDLSFTHGDIMKPHDHPTNPTHGPLFWIISAIWMTAAAIAIAVLFGWPGMLGGGLAGTYLWLKSRKPDDRPD